MDSNNIIKVKEGWTEVKRPTQLRNVENMRSFFENEIQGKVKDSGEGGWDLQFELASDAILFNLKFSA